MNRINLNVTRNFGDLITDTFVFLRQEFKGILKNFCVLVLPFILLDIVGKNMILQYASSEFDMYDFDMSEYMSNVIPTYVISIIVYTWIMLFTLSYMKIYNRRYLTSENIPITYKEVWANMIKNLGPIILWMFLYLLIVIIAAMCLIVPGIWLGILFVFTPCLLIIKDKPFGEAAFNTSFISGEWWSTFGILLVMGLIVNIVASLFSVPFMVYTFTQSITEIGENNVVPAILQGIAVFFSNFLQIVTITTLGMKFFSIQEKQEHQMLYRKIDNIGDSATKTDNEGEY